MMNYRIVDDAGQELAMSGDLGQLKAQLGQAARLTFSRSGAGEHNPLERDDVKHWDFGDLPQEITFNRAGKSMIGFPALAERDGKVSIRLFDTREAAETSMRSGVRQLLRFDLKEQMKQLEKDLSGQGAKDGRGGKGRYLAQAAFQLHTLIKPDLLKEDILNAVADRAFIADDALPRSEKEFAAQRQRARVRLPAVAEALVRIVQSVADEYQSLMARVSSIGGAGKVGMQKTGAASGGSAGNPGADLMIQLRNLIYPGFLSATPWERLQHLPRYLKGMILRLDKYGANPERDARHAAAIADYGTGMNSALKNIARREPMIPSSLSSAGRSRSSVFRCLPRS